DRSQRRQRCLAEHQQERERSAPRVGRSAADLWIAVTRCLGAWRAGSSVRTIRSVLNPREDSSRTHRRLIFVHQPAVCVLTPCVSYWLPTERQAKRPAPEVKIR